MFVCFLSKQNVNEVYGKIITTKKIKLEYIQDIAHDKEKRKLTQENILKIQIIISQPDYFNF